MMRKAMIAVGIVAPLVLVTQANGQTTTTNCSETVPGSVYCTSSTTPDPWQWKRESDARMRELRARRRYTSPWAAAAGALGEGLSKIPQALANDADRRRRIAEHEAYMEYMRAQTEAIERQNRQPSEAEVTRRANVFVAQAWELSAVRYPRWSTEQIREGIVAYGTILEERNAEHESLMEFRQLMDGWYREAGETPGK